MDRIELPARTALSIKQPWSWLIVNGYKDIENRNWRTNFRGPFLIHSCKKFDLEGWKVASEILKTEYDKELPEVGSLEYKMGGIVGSAELVDCVDEHSSAWFFGLHGFVLKNAKPLPFMQMRGKLGFYHIREAM